MASDASRMSSGGRPICRNCWFCGIQLTTRTQSRDHLVPRSTGGGSGHNMVWACKKCNNRKAALTLEEFRLVFFAGKGGEFWGEKAERNPMMFSVTRCL